MAQPRMNETSWAILASVVISVILATIMVGSPLHALRLAYLDYGLTQAAAPQK
jgi:hypothetical protein